MNYARIKNWDVANGPGVRTTLFVSGCRHHCKNCFNKETWDFNYGTEFTDDTIKEIIEMMKPDYITGLSVLGGEPFEPENLAGVAKLIYSIRTVYPSKSIWAYTGGLYETVNDIDFCKDRDDFEAVTVAKEIIFENIDVLVDGPFIEELKDVTLKFRGSSNQRLIDMKETRRMREVVLFDESLIKTASRNNV